MKFRNRRRDGVCTLHHLVAHPEQPAPRSDPTHSAPPTRVLCVDDRADNAQVIRMLIDSDPGMTCVGCLECADHLVEDVQGREERPDVVILDATMPGRDPLEALAELSALFPATRTLIYSGSGDDQALIHRAMGAGAWGCVDKNDEPGELLRAVHEIASGHTSWPGHHAG